MSASLSYAIDLMRKGHPRSSAARASGCHEADLPVIAPVRVEFTPTPKAIIIASPTDRFSAIMTRVGEPYGVTPKMMRDIRRTRKIAWVRMAAMAAVHAELPRLSYPAIGRAFGGRDHSTVMHGVREHNARMAWAEFLIWAGNPDGQPDQLRVAA